MNKKIITCRKCGETLVFIEGDHAELNYNFVKHRTETDKYIWPEKHIPFARDPANRSTMKIWSDQWKNAEIRAAKEGRSEPTRREKATILPVLNGLQHTHHHDFNRLKVSLASPITLVCKCRTEKIIGQEDTLC